uniref:NADH dehydrogenase subunit 2 n=1 Tax=Benedenia seriolae TaxID=160838 RepID=A0A499W8I5_BENSE|nr:NADH dehydrogenase subunit 2 [Benedenia seriolae]BBJ70619.1 NADH dehydrogenase subunit 2 [Benedenia seriolae]BBJ70631.1 NADH dehydrogenase subunit 2 [Benedenia seriolae]BBJ70643.1 NADH dehydrogenase subunit 2 [Benedenia seriolae]BBJ70666.1 NADH dehydrogenase subunit 2 [Benedenia seriolae]
MVSKILCPLISIFLFNNNSVYWLLCTFFFISCIFNSLFFWFGVSDLRLLWANISLNSSSVLFLIFFLGCSQSLYLLYCYLFWSSLVCLIFFYNDIYYINILFNWGIISILFAIPFSLGLVYKVTVITCLLGCNSDWIIVIPLFFYNIVEQYYLFKLLGYNSSSIIYNY